MPSSVRRSKAPLGFHVSRRKSRAALDWTDEDIRPYVVSGDLQLPEERRPHFLLMSRVQLGAGAGHMEHVSGSLPLGVDDCDFDIAAQFRHRGADVVQQSGTVLGNDLDQGAVLRTALSVWTLVSIFTFGFCTPGLNFVSMRSTTLISPETASESFRLEAVDFGRIELKRAKPVREAEGVEHYARLVGKGFGLQNIHSPG